MDGSNPDEFVPKKSLDDLPAGFPEDFREFDQDVMSDIELIEGFCNNYGLESTDLTEEAHDLVLELSRRQMFTTAKEMFFEYRYGRKLEVDLDKEFREYFTLFMDTFYPPTDPRRLAFEVAWMNVRIDKLRTLQERAELVHKRQGHKGLILPPPKTGPGGTSQN